MASGEEEIVNPLEPLLGYQLRRASAAILSELVAQFEAKGLRLSEGSVLMLVARNPGINQSSVGRALDIQRANMAPLVGQLAKQGLIERRKVDGRSFGLNLSKRGQQIADAIAAISAEHDAKLTAALPAEMRDSFGMALRALRRAWEPAPDPAPAIIDGADEAGASAGSGEKASGTGVKTRPKSRISAKRSPA